MLMNTQIKYFIYVIVREKTVFFQKKKKEIRIKLSLFYQLKKKKQNKMITINSFYFYTNIFGIINKYCDISFALSDTQNEKNRQFKLIVTSTAKKMNNISQKY